MTASVCCIYRRHHNQRENAPHQLRASALGVLKLNQPPEDPKRNCTYLVAEDFHEQHNPAVIYSARDHRIHRARHRCMWTIFSHWKRVERNQLVQLATTNCHERSSVYEEREVAEDVVDCFHRAAHHTDTHRKYFRCSCFYIWIYTCSLMRHRHIYNQQTWINDVFFFEHFFYLKKTHRLRRNSPSTWANHSSHSIGNNDSSASSTTPSQHFRTATSEPVSSHFQSDYFSARGRRGSLRPPRSFSKFN